MLSVVLSSYIVRFNHPIAAALERGFRLRRLGEARSGPPAHVTDHPEGEIVLLGFFQNAEALARELHRSAPELLAQDPGRGFQSEEPSGRSRSRDTRRVRRHLESGAPAAPRARAGQGGRLDDRRCVPARHEQRHSWSTRCERSTHARASSSRRREPKPRGSFSAAGPSPASRRRPRRPPRMPARFERPWPPPMTRPDGLNNLVGLRLSKRPEGFDPSGRSRVGTDGQCV